ncbi:MAG: hypothetical protein JSU68_00215 [Phycisphaerales bacterium]|nr:MAG: hypothetical protein JSU68_00215 [Phycisphaerales bacterium]
MEPTRHIRTGRVVFAMWVAAFVVSVAGCDSERSYSARPVVSFTDLGSGREDYDSTDYRIMTADEGAWRFPTRVAVARVTVADTACLPDEPRLVFSKVPYAERPAWHECMRDIPEVCEVFFLLRTDFPGKTISLEEMAAVAGRYRARLLLVYAESDLQWGEARVIGVMIDTRTGEILATVAASDKPPILRGFEMDRPMDRGEDDDRHVDPRYQAALKFRGLVHDCVLELKERQEVEGAVAQADPEFTS